MPDDYTTGLTAALQELQAVPVLTLPWEGGGWLGLVLGRNVSEPLIKRPRLCPVPVVTPFRSISSDVPFSNSRISEPDPRRFRIARSRNKTSELDLSFKSSDADRNVASKLGLLFYE